MTGCRRGGQAALRCSTPIAKPAPAAGAWTRPHWRIVESPMISDPADGFASGSDSIAGCGQGPARAAIEVSRPKQNEAIGRAKSPQAGQTGYRSGLVRGISGKQRQSDEREAARLGNRCCGGGGRGVATDWAS